LYHIGNSMKAQENSEQLPIVNQQGTDTEMLELLKAETFKYFLNEINLKNGLIADKTQPGSPSSIAVVGLGITSYIVAVERGLISRAEAVKRTLTVLRFFHSSKQGTAIDATGYKGFYYHFLDMNTGTRALECELSTIDTAILIAGMLTVKYYFTDENKEEMEIGRLADELYLRVDWQWALNGGKTITHGWNPESGFLPYRWDNGYSEAIILYVLALGSPTFPIDPEGYKQWTKTFEWKKMYNMECIYGGPLFIHQMSHIWLDFKGIKDELNKKIGIDYFENSRRSTCVQQRYAIDNPQGFAHYGENGWGFTASDGPGPSKISVDGIKRKFYDYKARGAPFGPDDGTISPWAVVASLPFEPGKVLETIRHAIEKLDLKRHNDYGFAASFNPSFPPNGMHPNGWISPWQFGLNQGPIIIMIENFQSGLIWNTIKKCPYIIKGLRRAGFMGGWLELIS
jgi:hypothetical protein